MNKIYFILLSSIIFAFFMQINICGEDIGAAPEIKANNFSDNLKIKGRVVDSKTGEPIIGATIAVKGTTAGAFSDNNGNFSISVQDTNAILAMY
jgi:hypothetical protein